MLDAHTHTDPTTVTLAAHVRRGLINTTQCKNLVSPHSTLCAICKPVLFSLAQNVIVQLGRSVIDYVTLASERSLDNVVR